MIKLFKPQVHLVKRRIDEQSTQYFLHAVTYFDQTNFKTDGFDPISNIPDENGIFNVRLKVLQDSQEEGFNYYKPLVHTLDLGVLPFDENNSKLQVDVFAGASLVGKSIVDAIDAEEDGKPGNQ